MAKLTIVTGVLLVILGIVTFVATGSYAPTALIPAYFGIALGILGLLANTPESRRRMLFMHIAVTVGLLGFVFPGWRGIGDLVARARGQAIVRPVAMEEELAMAAICLIFVLLCVRSFVAARRQRVG